MEFTSSQVAILRDVSVYQGDKQVLEDVSFDINKGEFVYLIGRTGSGKSSLLKTMYGDLRLRLGNAFVAGYQIKNIKRSEIPWLRRKIGIIFQDFHLFFDRSVVDNLFFVMRATGWKSRAKMKERLADVLMRVGLGAVESKMPHQLSGGEQQRVVIARALINEPLILFADEPTGNLDPEVAEGIVKLFMEINNSGTTIIMATHNYTFIEKYPSRVLKCEEGKVLDSQQDKFSYSDVI